MKGRTEPFRHEDERVVVILDRRPLAKGHSLVIPKKHFNGVFDADSTSLCELVSASQRVAQNVCRVLGLDSVTIVNQSGPSAQTVPHLHIHVIPWRRGDLLPYGYHLAKNRLLRSIRSESPATSHRKARFGDLANKLHL